MPAELTTQFVASVVKTYRTGKLVLEQRSFPKDDAFAQFLLKNDIAEFVPEGPDEMFPEACRTPAP